MATQLPDLVARVRVDTSDLGRGEKAAGGFAGNLKKMAGAAAVAFAAVKVGGLVQEAAALDGKMREVVTLFGETGSAADASLGDIKGMVRGLSDEFGFAQETLTGGLYQAISAGVPKDNALEFMKVASQAAVAGVTDVETSVDGLSTVINAFGLEADQAQAVSDSLFTAVKGGKTDFSQLSSSLFNVAPAAAAAGVSFQEVNAAIATLTAGGTPTSVATTQIRAALTGLQKPSADLDKIFQSLGHQNAQVAIESEGLGYALDAVKKASKGNNGELQKLLGSSEAVAAANVLAGTSAEKFAQEMENQGDAAGATAAAFDVVNEGAQRQMQIASTRMKNIGISLGGFLLPIVVKVMAGFRRIGEVVKTALTPAFRTVKDVVKQVTDVLFKGDFTGGPFAEDSKVIDVLFRMRDALLRVKRTVEVFIAGLRGENVDGFSKHLGTAAEVGVRVREVVERIVTAVRDNFMPVLRTVGTFLLNTFTPTFRALSDHLTKTMLPAIRGLFVRVQENLPALQSLARFLAGVIVVVAALAAKVLGFLLPILIRLSGFLAKTLFAAIGVVIGAIGRMVTHFQGTWEQAKTLARIVGEAFSAMSGAGDRMRDAIISGLRWLIEKALGIFQNFIDGGARLFGWLPGVGPKLKQAAAEFDTFRKGVTASLNGIPKTVNIKVHAAFQSESLRDAQRAANKAAGDGPGKPVSGGSALARVQGVLGRTGGYVTSTYRTPERNRQVGGSPRSYHLDRNNPAVDIGGPTAVLDRVAARLRAMGGWRELLWRTAGHYDHVHVAHKGGQVSGSWYRSPGDGPDERTARLQVGETVLPKGYRPPAGAAPTVHVYIGNEEVTSRVRVVVDRALDDVAGAARYGVVGG